MACKLNPVQFINNFKNKIEQVKPFFLKHISYICKIIFLNNAFLQVKY